MKLRLLPFRDQSAATLDHLSTCTNIRGPEVGVKPPSLPQEIRTFSSNLAQFAALGAAVALGEQTLFGTDLDQQGLQV